MLSGCYGRRPIILRVRKLGVHTYYERFRGDVSIENETKLNERTNGETKIARLRKRKFCYRDDLSGDFWRE